MTTQTNTQKFPPRRQSVEELPNPDIALLDYATRWKLLRPEILTLISQIISNVDDPPPSSLEALGICMEGEIGPELEESFVRLFGDKELGLPLAERNQSMAAQKKIWQDPLPITSYGAPREERGRHCFVNPVENVQFPLRISEYENGPFCPLSSDETRSMDASNSELI